MSSLPVLSRDEEWQPPTPEEQLDHLASIQQIRQLPYRYALFLDSRDMDQLMELFSPVVQVGKDKVGREHLREWYVSAMSRLDRTIHFVGNHVLNFVDADHASGVVYCRDEVESNGRWRVGHLQYWDTYERVGGRWYFVRRGYNRWAVGDELVRANSTSDGQALTTGELPQLWPSWDEFWAEHGQDRLGS
jgi:hypothetical protein